MGYDAAGHLISLVKRLNDSTNLEEKIAENTYNELGQLLQRKIGVAASGQLDTLTYTYNIKGWLAGIKLENFFQQEQVQLLLFLLQYMELQQLVLG